MGHSFLLKNTLLWLFWDGVLDALTYGREVTHFGKVLHFKLVPLNKSRWIIVTHYFISFQHVILPSRWTFLQGLPIKFSPRQLNGNRDSIDVIYISKFLRSAVLKSPRWILDE